MAYKPYKPRKKIYMLGMMERIPKPTITIMEA